MTFGVVAFASAAKPSALGWQQQPTVVASSSVAVSPSSTSQPIAASPALSAPMTLQASVVTSVAAPALTKPSAPLKWASALPSSSPSSPSHPIAASPASSAAMASQAPVVTSVVGPPALALVPSVAASSLDGPKRKHETHSQQPPLTESRPQGSASAVMCIPVSNSPSLVLASSHPLADQQRTKTLVVEKISSAVAVHSRPITSTATQHPLPQRAVTSNTTSATPKGQSASPPPRQAPASNTASVGNMTLPLKSGPSTTNIASTSRAPPVGSLATHSSMAPKATVPSPRALPAQTSAVASVESAVNTKPQTSLAVNSSSSSATTPAKTPMLISSASASTSSPVSTTPPSPTTNAAATTSRPHAGTSPAASVSFAAPAAPAAPGNAPPRTARDIFQLHEQRLHALERSIVKLQQQQDVEQPDEHQPSRPPTSSQMSSQMDRLIAQMKLHQSVQAKQNNFAKEMYESQRELNTVLKHFDDSMKDFIKMNSDTKEFGKAQKKSLQDNLEIFNRELADLRAATLKQRIELEEMRQQSETRMREEAELEGTRYRVELQEQRIQTLEKDLESRRTEATLMMVKAREEIVASKEQVAKAREERAVAKEQAAQAEVEKLMLLSRIQQMEMYMMKMNVPPLSAPVTSSAATSADPPAASDAAQGSLQTE
ncbi:hypothetical protein BGZ68_004287 [Mortierella alpina]|nr:hypothetical protein BGZ68_004287 [Mortierella alpina]